MVRQVKQMETGLLEHKFPDEQVSKVEFNLS